MIYASDLDQTLIYSQPLERAEELGRSDYDQPSSLMVK